VSRWLQKAGCSCRTSFELTVVAASPQSAGNPRVPSRSVAPDSLSPVSPYSHSRCGYENSCGQIMECTAADSLILYSQFVISMVIARTVFGVKQARTLEFLRC
jgi:hypothetical protein